jgi:DNA-binding ferritin-like protein (Dps family)
LLATLGLLIVTMWNKGRISDARPWPFAVIVFLAVASTVLVVWTRMRRDKYTAGLAPAYFASYEAVADWLSVSALSRQQRREVLGDVLELLYHAQETARPSTDVVGDDVGAFVDRVQQSHGYRGTLEFHLLSGVQYLGLLLPLLQLVNWVAHPGTDSYLEATMGISMIPFIALLAFVVMPLTQLALVRNRIVPALAFPLGIGLLFVLCSELGRRYAWHLPWVRTFLDGEVVVVGSWGIALLWGAAVAGASAGKWWLRRRALNRV